MPSSPLGGPAPVARMLAGPAVAVVVLVTAACGNATTSTAPDAPMIASAAPGAAVPNPDEPQMKQFSACLRDNGVQLPDDATGMPPADGTQPPTGAPGPGGEAGGVPMEAPPGVDKATWQKALKACADTMPKPPAGAGGTTT